ncbi:MAG: DUF4258 domain-containing protein [Spirochaetota bacterium]
MGADEFLDLLRDRAKGRILYLSHAIERMACTDRMISTQDVRSVILAGEVIEKYPNDTRGHGCLMLGRCENGWALHVVCGPKDEYLAVITAAIPTEGHWDPGFRRRKEA